MDRSRRRLSAGALLLLLALVAGMTAVFARGSSHSSSTIAVDIHTIAATTDARGRISPSGAVSVPAGSAQTFRIIPGTAFHVADVLVDGSSVGAVSAYTFDNVTADHSIAATFAIDPGVTAVAPSDWPHPEDAAYVCDGTDDQVEIQTAIDALGGSPGRCSCCQGPATSAAPS